MDDFTKIPDALSDELLAAYIDGNTTAEENALISQYADREELHELLEVADDSLVIGGLEWDDDVELADLADTDEVTVVDDIPFNVGEENDDDLFLTGDDWSEDNIANPEEYEADIDDLTI